QLELFAADNIVASADAALNRDGSIDYRQPPLSDTGAPTPFTLNGVGYEIANRGESGDQATNGTSGGDHLDGGLGDDYLCRLAGSTRSRAEVQMIIPLAIPCR
ncbi:MAG TPA: hypothetical protein VHG52_13730, partial [Thermomicrobiales bacterium]|nr:hypothetical protein [Thermomicrobiales bacterium]